MTSQNKFYRPISELDNDGGYADIFLSPLCDIYKDMVDSYIIELKYCKSQTIDEQVKKLFEEASAQISRYADSDMVREAVRLQSSTSWWLSTAERKWWLARRYKTISTIQVENI